MGQKPKNAALHEANRAKKDEFYTQMNDIAKELVHYRDFFAGKTVLCNCDDPYESNFFKYFALNFQMLKLKKLIATCYDSSPVAGEQLSLFRERHPYSIEITEIPDANGDGAVDLSDVEFLLKNRSNVLRKLKSGDFRSEECIELLKEADVVVTNPPFSLFREYVAQLVKHEKKFLIIGNINALTYKEIFPLIKENRIWLGYSSGAYTFQVPITFERNNTYTENGNKYAKFGNICWFTNIDITKRHEMLVLYKHYTPEEYPKYDNYDAINVDKVSDIPCDYFEDMGVPITFLDKHNPEQFDIVSFRKGDDGKDLSYSLPDHSQSVHVERRAAEDPAVLPDRHSSQDVTALWEFPSLSSISTIHPNLILSDLPQEISEGLPEFQQQREKMVRISMENSNTEEYSSSVRCNGIMGVPVTFLDKYNPDQFEIIGNEYELNIPKGRGYVNGKRMYSRIFIKRRTRNEN